MIESQLDAIINDLDTMRQVKLGELGIKDAPPIVTDSELLLQIANSEVILVRTIQTGKTIRGN